MIRGRNPTGVLSLATLVFWPSIGQRGRAGFKRPQQFPLAGSQALGRPVRRHLVGRAFRMRMADGRAAVRFGKRGVGEGGIGVVRAWSGRPPTGPDQAEVVLPAQFPGDCPAGCPPVVERECPARFPQPAAQAGVASLAPPRHAGQRAEVPRRHRVTATPDLPAGPGSDGVLDAKTARPDIRQSERLMPRVPVGSAMRWRHARTARSMPGIDRCFRKEFLDIFLPGFCLSVRRMADPVRKVHEKKFATTAQQTDNERKEFLAGIAGAVFSRRNGKVHQTRLTEHHEIKGNYIR